MSVSVPVEVEKGGGRPHYLSGSRGTGEGISGSRLPRSGGGREQGPLTTVDINSDSVRLLLGGKVGRTTR